MKQHIRHTSVPLENLHQNTFRQSGTSPQETVCKPKRSHFFRHGAVIFVLIYGVLLLWSHLVRQTLQVETPANYNIVQLRAVGGNSNPPVRMAYREFRPAESDSFPVLIMLHGSPMGSESFDDLGPALGQRFHVLVPDLPGFGYSSATIPDYSIAAHASYILQWMDSLRIERAHLIAYSMGGGVAINVADRAPERIASIDLLSSIGVQELELLGDHHMNHAVHAAQLTAIWLLQEAFPHFGAVDRSLLNMRYARNFYDSDQRPLREMLQRYHGPMLIQHGVNDGLVSVAAAKEHHRIVPQSEMMLYNAGHGLAFLDWQRTGADIRNFVERVEAGKVATRDTAESSRLVVADQPFDPASVPPAHGLAFVLIFFLLIIATFVSEDLTCIGAGLMIAKGTIGFFSGTLACFIGIFVGDLGLYWAGKFLGRPSTRKAPMRWFVKESDLQKSTRWFAAKGPTIILASRFLPGSRLPTYFAAGMLQMKLARFVFYFLVASAIWTPILVGLASVLGSELYGLFALYQQYALLAIAVTILSILVIMKLIVPLFTYKGRRLLLSAWRRKARWEFWSPWFFYIPIVGYVLFLAVRFRSLSLFTLANPGMPEGGFIGESKHDILTSLSDSPQFVARHSLLDADLPMAEKRTLVRQFMEMHNLDFPIVLKPDVGQRGSGVMIVRSQMQLDQVLAQARHNLIVQEYVAGEEFGVFYVRKPDQAFGVIFSITEKRFPAVVGDGERNTEELILADDRAVCMAPLYLKRHEASLYDVPAAGERIQLVELGTHSRGALFLDGMHIHTDALSKRIDALSQQFDGFFFGRFDIRTTSVADFQRGENFKIVELNGVTSEATHIYDPKNSVWSAYRTLMQQWRLAFEIGAANRARGMQPTSVSRLIKLLKEA
ncbi:alpha/beta fold hydrolase [candidate division KSB1 bacterium]|nr:alpha/beta fold hydrolase [candidate division KSB1 bacterium]